MWKSQLQRGVALRTCSSMETTESALEKPLLCVDHSWAHHIPIPSLPIVTCCGISQRLNLKLRIVQQRVPGAGEHRLRIASLRALAFPHRAGVRKEGMVGRGREKDIS